jgi:hypothetical protein
MVLDLGSTPLANALPADPSTVEPTYPLAVAICRECALVQTTYWVSGELLFGADYPYYSSYSTDYLRHARDHALELIERRALGAGSLVVEIASNDGYLLRNFAERGVPVLGIDPARGPAEKAREMGVPTLGEYFGADLARRLRAEGRRADVVLGNNVLAHVDDPNQSPRAWRSSSSRRRSGLEVLYLVDLVERCAFDTIYHEHNWLLLARAPEPFRAPWAPRDRRSAWRSTVGRCACRWHRRRERPAVAGSAPRDRLGVANPDFTRSCAAGGVQTRGLRDSSPGRASGASRSRLRAAAKGATLANAAGIGLTWSRCSSIATPPNRPLPPRCPHSDRHRATGRSTDLLLVFAWNLPA